MREKFRFIKTRLQALWLVLTKRDILILTYRIKMDVQQGEEVLKHMTFISNTRYSQSYDAGMMRSIAEQISKN